MKKKPLLPTWEDDLARRLRTSRHSGEFNLLVGQIRQSLIQTKTVSARKLDRGPRRQRVA